MKLLYEIGVALRSITPFVESFCIRECEVVYEGILMRSLLVSPLHWVFYSRHRHYELILMGSIDLISGMASKTLFNLGKYRFGHDNKHAQSSDIVKTFCVIMLEVLC